MEDNGAFHWEMHEREDRTLERDGGPGIEKTVADSEAGYEAYFGDSDEE